MLIKLLLKEKSSSHKGLQAQHIPPGLPCKRLTIFKFIYHFFLILTIFEIQATWLFFLSMYRNLIRCSRCSWKRNLEKILLLYSISWWHSFCCQFKWKTSDEMLHIDLFQNFQTPLFFHCICTYIYSFIHIYTHFKLLFLSTLFFLLNFCAIWRHWLVSTVMSCLNALPSGETKKHPYNSKRVSESIYWPISLLPSSSRAYHRHTMQGWPAKLFQICVNVEWL